MCKAHRIGSNCPSPKIVQSIISVGEQWRKRRRYGCGRGRLAYDYIRVNVFTSLDIPRHKEKRTELLGAF